MSVASSSESNGNGTRPRIEDEEGSTAKPVSHVTSDEQPEKFNASKTSLTESDHSEGLWMRCLMPET